MINVVVEQIVRREPEEVFNYLADFENNPEWQGGMQSARFTSEGPLGVGGDPSGFFSLAAPLMKMMVKRSVTGDYQRLAEILEG